MLGDVVCGGFAMPIRDGYANEVYIVSSGEMMSLYAASNIAAAVKNFKFRGYARLMGIILNEKNMAGEYDIARKAAAEIGTDILYRIPRCGDIQDAEQQGGTVYQWKPESVLVNTYNGLADMVLQGKTNGLEDQK